MDMQSTDTKNETDKVCIIGAGSSGLAAAKTFAERGIPFDCLEREDDIGGLWNETTGTGVVYDTTLVRFWDDFENDRFLNLFAVTLSDGAPSTAPPPWIA